MKKTSKLLFFILLFFTTNVFSASLSWDANTETDLAGYKVYEGTSSDPDTLVLIDTLGKVTTYMLSDDINSCMYYAVTAFDFEALESDFSNIVSNCDGLSPSSPGTLIFIKDSNVNITVVNP